MDNLTEAAREVALLPQELIDDLAAANAPHKEIFQAHGFPVEVADRLEDNPVLKRQVAVRKRELEVEGSLHISHAKFVREQMLMGMLRKCQDPATPSAFFSDAYKALTAVIEPKNAVPVAPGTGFSVNIIIRGENITHRKPGPKVIEHDPLGDPPAHIVALNKDLEYTE
ncbi:MAG: hypothetical protein KGL39_33410 [Patescibacteria group bacterium]|nr:hypothetical protein [Patescibacteria group bacterium]